MHAATSPASGSTNDDVTASRLIRQNTAFADRGYVHAYVAPSFPKERGWALEVVSKHANTEVSTIRKDNEAFAVNWCKTHGVSCADSHITTNSSSSSSSTRNASSTSLLSGSHSS